MLSATVIGAEGFVGSAFVRLLRDRSDVQLREVTRNNYESMAGVASDVVIDAAGNSRKYIAEREPIQDFELTAAHRLKSITDFPATVHLHISSVDVYDDLTSPATTAESVNIDIARQSHYGFHKLVAENIVRHHATQWLIVRLAGMVGSGLRKNPVFDILHGRPLSIHPDSKYQFMTTDDAATTAWSLLEDGIRSEVFNVCGAGTVSPREIAGLAGRTIVEARGVGEPRIVDVNIRKIETRRNMPDSRRAVSEFVAHWPAPTVGRA